MVSLMSAARQLRARIGALARAASEDTGKMTAPARAAFLRRFEDQVDPEQRLPAEERVRRAVAARRLYFSRLALSSVQAREKRAKGDGDGISSDLKGCRRRTA